MRGKGKSSSYPDRERVLWRGISEVPLDPLWEAGMKKVLKTPLREVTW